MIDYQSGLTALHEKRLKEIIAERDATIAQLVEALELALPLIEAVIIPENHNVTGSDQATLGYSMLYLALEAAKGSDE